MPHEMKCQALKEVWMMCLHCRGPYEPRDSPAFCYPLRYQAHIKNVRYWKKCDYCNFNIVVGHMCQDTPSTIAAASPFSWDATWNFRHWLRCHCNLQQIQNYPGHMNLEGWLRLEHFGPWHVYTLPKCQTYFPNPRWNRLIANYQIVKALVLQGRQMIVQDYLMMPWTINDEICHHPQMKHCTPNAGASDSKWFPIPPKHTHPHTKNQTIEEQRYMKISAKAQQHPWDHCHSLPCPMFTWSLHMTTLKNKNLQQKIQRHSSVKKWWGKAHLWEKVLWVVVVVPWVVHMMQSVQSGMKTWVQMNKSVIFNISQETHDSESDLGIISQQKHNFGSSSGNPKDALKASLPIGWWCIKEATWWSAEPLLLWFSESATSKKQKILQHHCNHLQWLQRSTSSANKGT